MAELLVTDHEELDGLGRRLFEAFDRGDVAEVLTKFAYHLKEQPQRLSWNQSGSRHARV